MIDLFLCKYTGKQRSDATRTEPVFIDGSGRAFWKLRCYAAEYAVLMQGNFQHVLTYIL